MIRFVKATCILFPSGVTVLHLPRMATRAATFLSKQSPFFPLLLRDKAFRPGLFSMPNVVTPEDLITAAQTALAKYGGGVLWRTRCCCVAVAAMCTCLPSVTADSHRAVVTDATNW